MQCYQYYHHIGNQMYLCSLGLHFDKFQHFGEK